eukprot:XP_003971078.1 PREDICTED: bicaudal D-related protein 1-like [Takifugu rubripes]
MAHSLSSFSALNERLRPRLSASDRLYSTLYRMEYGYAGSLKPLASTYRQTILPRTPEPEPEVSEASVDPEEPREDAAPEASTAEQACTEPSQLTEIDKISEEPDDEDSRMSPSEEKDVPSELVSKVTDASPQSSTAKPDNSLESSYIDGTLPDLVRSGRSLGRRRTLGHVSETLQEVRREVELSRKRSIKLKAQVDQLQKKQEGQGWSQHRERVAEEVLSVLRLLSPLTDPEWSLPEPSHGQNRLDVALTQLQNVARKLAMSHTTEVKSGTGAEDSGVLQQALYDRDEALEKKKAMEAELLRSKTELMLLNNQLLEAVQKRLELSLELEAWKEDVQLILNQQVLNQQQQAEQTQKKSSRMGILRRHNKPPIQRPSAAGSSAPAAPASTSNHAFNSGSAGSAAPAQNNPPLRHQPPPSTQRNWRDKLRMGRPSHPVEQESRGGKADSSFQVISLD